MGNIVLEGKCIIDNNNEVDRLYITQRNFEGHPTQLNSQV